MSCGQERHCSHKLTVLQQSVQGQDKQIPGLAKEDLQDPTPYSGVWKNHSFLLFFSF